mgnify:CR=1 FL=1
MFLLPELITSLSFSKSHQKQRGNFFFVFLRIPGKYEEIYGKLPPPQGQLGHFFFIFLRIPGKYEEICGKYKDLREIPSPRTLDLEKFQARASSQALGLGKIPISLPLNRPWDLEKFEASS